MPTNLAIDDRLIAEAQKLGRHRRAKGIAAFVVDALICQVALSRQWTLFTTNPDFTGYAQALPIKLHKPRAA